MAAMITLYSDPRRGGSRDSNGSDHEQIVPAGVPYLTKRNGKFFWVRSKQPQRLEIATDLLKSISGSRMGRKRSKSVQAESRKIPMIVGGEDFTPPGLPSQNTAPLPQSAFESPSMVSSFPQPTFGSPAMTSSFPQQILGSPAMTSSFQYPPFYPPCAHYHAAQPIPSVAHQMLPAYRVIHPNQDAVSNSDPIPAFNATHEDLDRLKIVDAHFRKVSMDQAKVKSGYTDKKEEGPKTAATMQKHVCVNCGNLRSNMYHHRNPIKPGETPAPSYCGKCQREETSDDETELEKEIPKKAQGHKAKKDKKEKTKEETVEEQKVRKDSKQPTVESSSERETVKTHKSHADSAIKETSRVRTHKNEYIIVEEEVSEDDRGRRGRSHKREHDQRHTPDDATHEDHDHHCSSYQAQSSRARSASQSKHERDQPQPAPRRRHQRQASNHSRQSTISYRHVPATKSKESERVRESYPQKIPVYYEEQEYSPDSASKSRRSSRSPGDYYATHSQRSYQQPTKVSVHYDEQHSSPGSPSRSLSPKKRSKAPSHHSYREAKKVPVLFSEQEYPQVFESRSRSPEKHFTPSPSQQSYPDTRHHRQSSVSTMAEWHDMLPSQTPSWSEHKAAYAARRSPVAQENSFDKSAFPQEPPSQYRPTRRTSPQSTANPWDEPHDLRAGPNVEEIVVTERFVYRKEKMSEEERRRQEALDREMLNFNSPRKPSHDLSAKDEASKYYTDDWSAEEELARRREAAEVNYDYDDGWRELPPEDEHIPGEWPEGEAYGSTWNYSVPETPRWGKKMEAGSWRRNNWQDSELVDDDNWSDTESWKALVAEKRLVRVSPPSNSHQVPGPTGSYSEPSTSFEPRRSRWANEYQTSPSLATEETPRRTSRSHPVYREESYKSPRASCHSPPVFSPHVTFGQDRVQYFDDTTPRRSRDSIRSEEQHEYEHEAHSEILGMTEAERELMRRGGRRRRTRGAGGR